MFFGLAAKDLTVQNAANVQISGNTNSGGVVENLTVINSSVAVQQRNSRNPTIVVENQITTDTPVLLQRPDFESGSGELITEAIAAADGKIWAYGGEAPTDELDINDAVTANTCWKAGDGMIYYEPAGDGGAARLTLDNASYEGNVYVSADSVEVVLTGGNQIGMIYADKATLTGSGSFTGMIDVNKNGFINNSSGKLNAMVILNDADDYGNCIIYGERSTADVSPDYPIILSSKGNFLTIAPGATLTVNDVGEDTPGLIISDTTKLSNQGKMVGDRNRQGKPCAMSALCWFSVLQIRKKDFAFSAFPIYSLLEKSPSP